MGLPFSSSISSRVRSVPWKRREVNVRFLGTVLA